MKRGIKIGIIIILFFAIYSYGQEGEISGNIIDGHGPLPGATVKLMQPEEKNEIFGEITDLEGDYTISVKKNKAYYLEVSYMGYGTVYTDSFQISSDQKEIRLDTITMKMESEMLETITIKESKRPVSFSNGKMNVQVENTPMARGESALSLLQQLPGVSTGQDGEIQLQGKSGVQIMVNGRKSYLKGQELQTYLESLPSDAIATIELDTKPSAVQDAEGGAGILNIQLKKSKTEALAGSVSAGYTYQDQHLWNSNVFLNQQNKKWDWSILIDASEKGNTRHQTLQTDFNEESSLDNLKQQGKETYKHRPIFTQLNINYDISETQSIGLSAELGRKKAFRDWNSESDINQGNESQNIQSFNRHREKFDYILAGVYYKLQTDTLGSGLEINLDGSQVKRNIKSRFENEYKSENSNAYTELFNAPADNDYEIFAAKADYKRLWKNGMILSFGSKYSQVKFKSHLDFFEIEEDDSEYDEERSNAFDYDENIWANYIEFTAKLHPKWTLNTGLRMEKTWGEGIEKLIDSKHKKNYIDWFPNVSLRQEVSESYQIEYAYNKRITRPQYEFLNPQIFYIDPYNYAEGNPSLQPQRTHSLSMNHLIKQKYQFGLSFDYNKDFMTEVPMTDNETNQTSFVVNNLKRSVDIGVNAYVPIKMRHYWNMNNSLVANYQSYKLDLEDHIKRINKHLFLLFQNQQQIQLPKDIQLNLNITARSPFNHGYYKIHGQWWTDISLKKSFLENKLDVSLKFTDIFKTMNIDNDYRFNGHNSSIKQYMGNRSASINLTYKFGGRNGKEKMKDTDFEEYERIGE